MKRYSLLLLALAAVFTETAFSRSDLSNQKLGEYCDAGETEHCAILEMRKFDESDGGDISEETISHFDQECETDGEACYSLAAIWYLRQGASRDFKKATKFAARSCQHDYALGCVLEGRSFGFVTDDKAEYQERFSRVNTRACQLELAEGCVNLFKFYYKQELIIDNLSDEDSIDYLKRGCALGDFPTCVQLADYYWQGHGWLLGQTFPKDRELAIQHYQQACDDGYGKGCVVLGDIYGGHIEREYRDLNKAIAYFKEACRLGAGGCDDLSDYFRFGKDSFPLGPDNNVGLADKLEIRSCETVKNSYACFKIAKRELEKGSSKTALIVDYYLLGFQYGCKEGGNELNCLEALKFIRDNTVNRSDIEVLRKYAKLYRVEPEELVCNKCEG